MSTQLIRIKKGRDLNIVGSPSDNVVKAAKPKQVAVLANEFPYLKPKLEVQEGDTVQIGSCLITDKINPKIKVLSPGAGKISKIERGPKRVLQKIIIDLDQNEDQVQFNRWEESELSNLDEETIINHLLNGGLWPYLIQRPFSAITNPNNAPRSIFINGMDTDPLSSKVGIQLKDQADSLRAGIKVLKKLTEGHVYLSISDKDADAEAFKGLECVQLYKFQGKHPAGNTSVHIHHIERLRKGETVWTINANEVSLIGWLFLEGRYPIERTIAIAGPQVKTPQHYFTRLGASISELLKDNLNEGKSRTISGSVLNGFTNQIDGFISFYKPNLTIIDDSKKREFIGWLSPGFDKLSFSRAFLSSLLHKGKPFNISTRKHGSLRAIVATDIYDRYLPMDIYSVPLIKALIAGDLENAEKLGALECAPEDFALASFMCPSKIDVCGIVRDGLSMIKKEYE